MLKRIFISIIALTVLSLMCVWIAISSGWIRIVDSDSREVVSGNASYMLNPLEILQLKGLAAKGDKEAAFKLAMYFGFIKNDEQEHERWLKVASELGHPIAQQNLETLKRLRERTNQQ